MGIIEQLKDKIVPIYGEYYFSKGESNDRYNPVKGTIATMLLNGIYEGLIKSNEITPVEHIPQSLKEKYWSIAITFSNDKNIRIQNAKSCYVLDLICGTIN